MADTAANRHTLRPYQERAVEATLGSPARRIVNVAPTGAGKTRIAVEYVSRATFPAAPGQADAQGQPSLFIVHRRELLQQAADRLRAAFGHLTVGVIAPGFDAQPFAPVQVATVQTLLAREQRPPATLIIVDEFHHFASDVSWAALLTAYPAARIIGLTATPQRQDGSPLSDVAEAMVVVAQYSELITDGFLVPCRVFQPPVRSQDELGGLALDPLTAYQRYGEGGRAFGFATSVKMSKRWADEFTAAGIPSRSIDGKQSKRERDEALAGLRAGTVQVLWNYNICTEGVDVPEASVLINCRRMDHVSTYLQACGRVLRPAPGKTEAIIIDLTGATLKHGFPTEDRDYSLSGEGIGRSTAPCLRNCLQCGATLHAAIMLCPHCGYQFTKRDPRIPHIFSMELKEVYAGAKTPQSAKSREYERLRKLARSRGYGPSWVVREYKKLFHEELVIRDATAEEREAELHRLMRLAAERGFKPGFAAVNYKRVFGSWPTRQTGNF